MPQTSSPVDEIGLHITRAGTGRAVMVIHGGGGTATVAPIAAHLAHGHP